MKLTTLRFVPVVAFALVAQAQQTSSTQPQAQAQSVQVAASPDAEIQALQIKLKALEIQKQIDALKVQQEAIEHPIPPKPPLPPCAATPFTNKPGRFGGLKQKAAQILAKETNQIGGKLGQSTHGTIDGSVIPTPQDVSGGGPNPRVPCAPEIVSHPVTPISH